MNRQIDTEYNQIFKDPLIPSAVHSECNNRHGAMVGLFKIGFKNQATGTGMKYGVSHHRKLVLLHGGY